MTKKVKYHLVIYVQLLNLYVIYCMYFAETLL